MKTMTFEPISGVTLITSPIHTDSRGELVAFEASRPLLFTFERMFFMKTTDPRAIRGGHANSCDELIVAVSGSVLADLDNGSEQSSIRLHRRDQALLIKAGVLIYLHEFEPDTLLLVGASARFNDTRHFERPQTHLMVPNA